MKYKKIRMKRGERIGTVPTRGAPKQKQSNGGRLRRENEKTYILFLTSFPFGDI